MVVGGSRSIAGWQEQGGAQVTPPKHTSFGTALLQIAIGGAETRPDLNYAPEGFTYTFQAPLADVARETWDSTLQGPLCWKAVVAVERR